MDLAAAAATGFVTAFTLILAIGAQNAFVLRQGLTNSHVFWVCLTCAISDAVAIVLGVVGFGAVAAAYPIFPKILLWGGALFLVAYGLSRFHAAWKNRDGLVIEGTSKGLAATIAATLAFTWLNPHFYLDTIGLIGAVSTNYPGLTEKTAFTLGAVASSITFFFSLGYGARRLAPHLTHPKTWMWLDVGIGVTMLALAAMLIATA